MKFENTDLEELKKIYRKHYSTQLSDGEASELGNRLVSFFKVVGQPRENVDIEAKKGDNI